MNWTVNTEEQEHSNTAAQVEEATNLENNGSLYSSFHIKEIHSMYHEKKSCKETFWRSQL